MIRYRFVLESGQMFQFEVHRQRVFDRAVDLTEHAPWTRLTFNQCERCSLTEAHCQHCPVALDVEQIANRFQDILSYERAQVEVLTPERTYLKLCDVQTGLRSLLGLVMATSACPVLSQLKGMASTHLPFATLEETLFRTAGAYLIQQYFAHKAGGQPDLDMRGLDALYKELYAVNRSFKTRLDSACSKDSNLNAIGSLIYVSMGVSCSLEDNLKELRGMFDRH
jgi:hypothetical protein